MNLNKYIEWLKQQPVVKEYSHSQYFSDKHNVCLKTIKREIHYLRYASSKSQYYYNQFKKGKVAFKILPPEKERKRDKKGNKTLLKDSSSNNYKSHTIINGKKHQRYMMAKGYHYPFGLFHAKWNNGKVTLTSPVHNRQGRYFNIKIIDYDEYKTNPKNAYFKRTLSDTSKGEFNTKQIHLQSKGEQIVKHFLNQYGIIYIYGYHNNNGYHASSSKQDWLHGGHLDFFIPKNIISKLPVAIEVDGGQHTYPYIGHNKYSTVRSVLQYKNQLNRDNLKDINCKNHHVHLIRIKLANLQVHGFSGTSTKQKKMYIYHTLRQKLVPMIRKNAKRYIEQSPNRDIRLPRDQVIYYLAHNRNQYDENKCRVINNKINQDNKREIQKRFNQIKAHESQNIEDISRKIKYIYHHKSGIQHQEKLYYDQTSKTISKQLFYTQNKAKLGLKFGNYYHKKFIFNYHKYGKNFLIETRKSMRKNNQELNYSRRHESYLNAGTKLFLYDQDKEQLSDKDIHYLSNAFEKSLNYMVKMSKRTKHYVPKEIRRIDKQIDFTPNISIKKQYKRDVPNINKQVNHVNKNIKSKANKQLKTNVQTHQQRLENKRKKVVHDKNKFKKYKLVAQLKNQLSTRIAKEMAQNPTTHIPTHDFEANIKNIAKQDVKRVHLNTVSKHKINKKQYYKHELQNNHQRK